MAGPSTISVVGFLDVDGYECQLYQREQPSTRFKPCIVVNSSGRVVATSPEAKKLGITRDKTPNQRDVVQLLKNLPDKITVHTFYKGNEFGKPETRKTRHGTWELLDAVKDYCSRAAGAAEAGIIVVELASSDEIYLELSGIVTKGIQMRKSNNSCVDFAEMDCFTVLEGHKSRPGPFRYYLNQRQERPWVRHAARDEERLIFGALFMRSLANHIENAVKLYTSSGVATSRFGAKIAAGLNRPGKTTIMTEFALSRVAKLINVTDIPGLGGKLGERIMEELYVKTLSDLRHVSWEQLEKVSGIGDMAAKVFSWARGRDNSAVIEREMKNTLRCNKPGQPVVSSISVLRKSIENLCAESKCLLEEEKSRHKRIVTSLKVEFSFKGSTQQSVSYNIFNYGELDELASKLFQVIREAGDIDLNPGKKFVLETLTSVMKDFIPLALLNSGDPANNLLQQFSSLCLGKGQPRIQELRIAASTLTSYPVPKFTNHEFISSFGTTGHEDYYWSDTVARLPKIISSSKYGDVIGTYLGSGYEESNLISDHQGFNELKHKQFLQWLQDYQLIEKIKSGKIQKPEFICFNGRLADTMQTPDIRQFADWQIYAMNVGGIIFLWDEKKPQNQVQKVDCYGLVFESLLRRAESPRIPTGTINEFEHVYAINLTQFGQHKLLVVNEIDAQDNNGNFVELRLMNERQGHARMAKVRRLWTTNVIAGVNKSVVGIRNEGGILLDIQDRTRDDLEMELGQRINACLYFQDRLLSWMKVHLGTGNGDIVMKYSWVCGGDRVNCEQIQQQQVRHLAVPRLYAAYLNKFEEEFVDCSN